MCVKQKTELISETNTLTADTVLKSIEHFKNVSDFMGTLLSINCSESHSFYCHKLKQEVYQRKGVHHVA